MAICTAWLCWAVLAPIVADKARAEPTQQNICPMPAIKHGIGPDLRTWTKSRDLCGD
jgi:hypothetical protein